MSSNPATLPSAITVEVNGAPIEALLGESSAGNPMYRGKAVIAEETDEPMVALAHVVAKVNGELLNAGEVKVTQPSKYAAGHPKAGQTIPNSGGKPIVTHTTVLTVKDSNGTDHRFNLSVQVKYDSARGFQITIGTMAITAAKPTLRGTENLSFLGYANSGE